MSVPTRIRDSAGPAYGRAALSRAPTEILDATIAGPHILPGGRFATDAQFLQQGDDLVLVAPDGAMVVVRGYFLTASPPDLLTPEGGLLDAAMVRAFTAPEAAGQVAQLGDGAVAVAIGQASSVVGQVFAVRANGVRVSLDAGDPVFQGDVIETADGGAVNILFVDKTTFALGAEARLALDKLVFNPDTHQGSSVFSILKGVFVFSSGEIAKANYLDMTVKTTVATIGIRGTKVAGEVNPAGEISKFTILEGEIVVTTNAGSVVLGDENETSYVTGFDAPPSESVVLSNTEINANYGEVRSVSQNYYGAGAGNDGSAPEDKSGQDGAGTNDTGNGDGASNGAGDGAPDSQAASDLAPASGGAVGEAEGEGEGAGEGAGDGEGAGGDLPDLNLSLLRVDSRPFRTDPDQQLNLTRNSREETGGEPGIGGAREGSASGGATDDRGGPNVVAATEDGSDSAGSSGLGDTGFVGGGNPFDFSTATNPVNAFGGDGDDRLIGGSAGDSLSGRGGDDVIDGGDGDDVIDGGTGSDILIGKGGDDVLRGGAGDDLYRVGVGEGADIIVDADGAADRLIVTGVTRALSGFGGTRREGGDLVVSLTGGDVTIDDHFGGGRVESITFEFTDGGASTLTLATGLIGGDADGIITGTDRNDFLDGGGGNDVIVGNGGDDVLVGGAGDDVFVVSGDGGGFDRVSGGAGFDRIVGGDGDDAIGLWRHSGADVVEEIDGGAGTNVIRGTGGPNSLYFGNTVLRNIARIEGGAGNDRITGSAGADTIDGGTGNDILSGGAGDDVLIGGGGADRLSGGDGDDRFVVDNSRVFRVDGGAGTDVFVLDSNLDFRLLRPSAVRGMESFDLGGGDGVALTLGLDNVLAATDGVNALTGTENTLVVRRDADDTVTVVGDSWTVDTATLDTDGDTVAEGYTVYHDDATGAAVYVENAT